MCSSEFCCCYQPPVQIDLGRPSVSNWNRPPRGLVVQRQRSDNTGQYIGSIGAPEACSRRFQRLVLWYLSWRIRRGRVRNLKINCFNFRANAVTWCSIFKTESNLLAVNFSFDIGRNNHDTLLDQLFSSKKYFDLHAIKLLLYILQLDDKNQNCLYYVPLHAQNL